MYFGDTILNYRVEVIRKHPLTLESDQAVRILKSSKNQLPVDGIFIVAETPPERLVFCLTRFRGHHTKLSCGAR